MLVKLSLTLALVPALHAGTITTGGECPSSITFPTSITYTIPESAGCNEGGTVTVSQSQFSAAISVNMGVGEGGGGLSVLVDLPDITVALGGSGLGYVDITYTDTVDMGTLWELEGVSGHAGNLTFNVDCNFYCAGPDETTTYSTGLIAVTNGEQIPLDGGGLYLSAGMTEAQLQGSMSVTASVTTVESWAAVPAASPESVPEALLARDGVARRGRSAQGHDQAPNSSCKWSKSTDGKKGFCRKRTCGSLAMAGGFPWPEISSTRASGWSFHKRSASLPPSISGIVRSEINRCTGCASKMRIASDGRLADSTVTACGRSIFSTSPTI